MFKAFRADTAAQPGDHLRQGGQVLLAAAQVGGDEGNRVIDFVGDARGNRAQGGHFFRMQQHRLHLVDLIVLVAHRLDQFTVLRLDLGDVGAEINIAVVLIGDVRQRENKHIHPVQLTVLAPAAHFAAPDAAPRLFAAHEMRAQFGAVLGVMHAFVLTDQLPEGKAAEGQKAVVGEGNDPFFVGGHYTVFIDDPRQRTEHPFVEFVLVRVHFDQPQFAAEGALAQRGEFRQPGFHVHGGPVGFVHEENDDQQDHRGGHQKQPLAPQPGKRPL